MGVKRRHTTLAHGRPPVSRPKEHMSSKQSRTIIRTHHRLQKEHAAALKKGDSVAVERLERAIDSNGGIKVYQAASKQGQAKDRGGDSSKVLVEWLQQTAIMDPKRNLPKMPYKLLEVGALSTNNEISKHPKTFNVSRIDLNSQEPGIDQQDFMERPLPRSDEERFDVISLSLVLNYVPDPVGRGEMLKRLVLFMRHRIQAVQEALPLPALFFVLPLPCVSNSRYLDEALLLEILGNLGFVMKDKRTTNKLCYYLLVLSDRGNGSKTPKKMIRDGPGMNNFCIVVK